MAIKESHPVLTIDGPAGSGKSSTAKAVAQELRWRHLNSGSLYRALALGLIMRGVSRELWPGLTAEEIGRTAVTLRPTGGGFDVLLDGRDVSSELRDGEVTRSASVVAALPTVRRFLLPAQKGAAESGPVVADGRDMGSVVFPDAAIKVFLVADVKERARRRLQDLGHGPPASMPEDVVDRYAQELAVRDARDSNRRYAPLVRPKDAHLLDTTRLDFGRQVALVAALARQATLSQSSSSA